MCLGHGTFKNGYPICGHFNCARLERIPSIVVEAIFIQYLPIAVTI